MIIVLFHVRKAHLEYYILIIIYIILIIYKGPLYIIIEGRVV